MIQKSFLVIICILCSFGSFPQSSESIEWSAKRITNKECQNESNTWYNFRKNLEIDAVPNKASAKRACDSK